MVDTAHTLKFLEDYGDRQAQLWKVLCKYHNLPAEVSDLHSHFESLKTGIEMDFKYFKEATSRNVENIKTSLTIQQTYSTTLCMHVNAISNRLAELEKQV